VADLAKTCRDNPRPIFPATGSTVDYYRCSRCGFLFSTFLDDWTTEQFRRDIYNDDYVLADPEFNGPRAERAANIVATLFGEDRRDLRLYDYGGGTGLLVDRLRSIGFANVDGGDPFFGSPLCDATDVDLVIALEVIEHLTKPDAVFKAAAKMLKPSGMVLVSTLFQPPNIHKLGTSWSYCAPRNGHISLHTETSLGNIALRNGFQTGSFNNTLHAAWRGAPRWLEGLLGRDTIAAPADSSAAAASVGAKPSCSGRPPS
jgi:2-polyprenyl-6-hydroxyphenyl methylase/3-demethylubiquinone-9 3-methyltransferase